MTDEQVQAQQEVLLVRAANVHLAFTEGRNPTCEQIRLLGAAIESLRAQKICGHRCIEDCDCVEFL